MVNFNVCEKLHEIRVPTLVIAGAADGLLHMNLKYVFFVDEMDECTLRPRPSQGFRKAQECITARLQPSGAWHSTRGAIVPSAPVALRNPHRSVVQVPKELADCMVDFIEHGAVTYLTLTRRYMAERKKESEDKKASHKSAL